MKRRVFLKTLVASLPISQTVFALSKYGMPDGRELKEWPNT